MTKRVWFGAAVMLGLGSLGGNCDCSGLGYPDVPVELELGDVCVGAGTVATIEVAAGATSVLATTQNSRALFLGGPTGSAGDPGSNFTPRWIGTNLLNHQVVGTFDYPIMCVFPGPDSLQFTANASTSSTPSTTIATVNCVPCGAIEDALEDYLDSISALGATYGVEFIDIARTTGITLRSLDEFTEVILNSRLSLEDEVGPFIIGSDSARDARDNGARDAGDLHVVSMELAAAIPEASDHSLIYSVVFDSDDDPANDWIAQDPYDWDLFQGTDRWYELAYDHTSGDWSLTATQVASNQSTEVVPTRALARIDGDWVTFLIPGEDLPSDSPAYRVTAFGHDGAFSEDDRGADVSGANPTEPLMPLD